MSKKQKNNPVKNTPKKKPAVAQAIKIICQNRKASFNYQLTDKYEAGMVLTGSEVKSLRMGKANLTDAYGDIRGNEVFLVQANIEPYDKGGYANHEPKRRRKLLMHRKEINTLIGKIQAKGLTLVPTKMYFKAGKAKVEMALGTGKKTYDKRHDIKTREVKKEMDRHVKRGRG